MGGHPLRAFDPDTDRVRLFVTRGQIEHFGHVALKTQMLVDNKVNIIAFGSCRRSGIHGNPLTAEQKRKAQRLVWGDAFEMVFLDDIGAGASTDEWCDFVLAVIRSEGLPAPTDLYSYSRHDARWYTRFGRLGTAKARAAPAAASRSGPRLRAPSAGPGLRGGSTSWTARPTGGGRRARCAP